MEKYDFGNKLYEYRTQKGLTQKELGKLLGVTDKAVSKWETGESKPRLDKMTQITELFDTSIDRMLGGEAQDCGEQLKPYKTIFDSTLKKYDKYYKTARIWTYIFAVVYFVFSLIQKVGRLLSGTIALNTVSSLIEITVLTAAVLIFTLKFKPKFGECENKDMNIFVVFLSLLYFAVGAVWVISAVKTGRMTGEYDEGGIAIICIQAVILAVALIISVIKKKYSVFAGLLVGFSLFNIFGFDSLYYLVICAVACQFICYIKKRHWLVLAQKADVDMRKTNESQKIANVFTAIIAVITMFSIIISSFSPYIIYKICLKKYGPTHLHNEVIDFDYSAEFTDSFTEIELGNAKLKMPNGFEKFGEADENEEFIRFRNEQKGFIMVSYYSEEEGGLLFDEFDESDPEEHEYYNYAKWLDSICQKYYGVPYSTFYGSTYLNYFLDLDDIKFYESEKAVFLCAELVSKMVMDTGYPMSVSKFDNGMYTGLISGRLMTIGDKSNVYWTADIWHSNDLDGLYYSITYMAKNTSDIKDSQMICQIVNSLEF